MSICHKCLPLSPKLRNFSIELIKEEYLKNHFPWFLGFSGGKDSSALLKLTFIALSELKEREKPVTVIYCDTGVEIPTVSCLVKSTLKNLLIEAREYKLPIRVRIACPDYKDRYFTKIIGRGYPPPTNKFRWCTDRLRISPVKKVLNECQKPAIVLLGIRKGESLERDKTLQKYRSDDFYFQQSGNPDVTIFAPIVNLNTKNVWDILFQGQIPKCIDSERLGSLYKDAGNECPIIKDSKGAPCGKSRFGCWTCTVVRRDKAVTSLVKEGYSNLQPLLEFRNWLATFRDNKIFRCRTRRNGQPGPGPFTLKARKQILDLLLLAQRKSKLKLITSGEIKAIRSLWDLDKNSKTYKE